VKPIAGQRHRAAKSPFVGPGLFVAAPAFASMTKLLLHSVGAQAEEQ